MKRNRHSPTKRSKAAVSRNHGIGRACRRNAVLNAADYEALAGKLDYFDLCELQDVICGKATWTGFEPRFANKEAVSQKFNHLAELRNALHHSRSVDEVTRKEGEAAILWFEKVVTG